MVNRHIETAAKVQAVCLVEFAGKSQREAEKMTGVSARTIARLQVKARQLGFDPVDDPAFRGVYFQQDARSGRPPTCDAETSQAIVQDLQNGKEDREQSLDALAATWKISRSVIARLLKKEGLHKVKPSMKPGLTEGMKQT